MKTNSQTKLYCPKNMLQKLLERHPIIAYLLSFIVFPVCILGAVYSAAYLVMLPASLVFGWL